MSKTSIPKELHRDVFNGKFGFFMSNLGSAIGLGNILIFPYMVANHGGGAFILAYLILVLFVGTTGIIAEMALGRAMRSGPWEAFKNALKMRNIVNKNWLLGIVPLISAIFIAIVYSVATGWVIYYTFGELTGTIQDYNLNESFYNISGNFKSIVWQISGFFLAGITMVFGIKNNIEKRNRVIINAMFIILAFLLIRVVLLDNSYQGYQYLITINKEDILNPSTWVYAMGQTLFSLSIIGSSMIMYGSHLKKSENLVALSTNIALFDISNSILMSLIVIPAAFSFNIPLNSGISLMFSVVPRIFSGIPLGNILCAVFFFTVLSTAITSLISLFEAPVELIQTKLNIPRKISVISTITICAIIGLFLEDADTISTCFNIIYVYLAPICALISTVIFYVICKRRFIKVYIQEGLHRTIGKKFVPIIRFTFISITALIFIIGILFVRI